MIFMRPSFSQNLLGHSIIHLSLNLPSSWCITDHILIPRIQANGRNLLSSSVCFFYLFIIHKLISCTVSQDTANYKDAPTEGIRRVLETVTGEKIPRGSVLNTDKIGLLMFTLLP